MIQWEQLRWHQKAAFWIFIGIIGWFAPEIALLMQFGGIEVTFAFLAVYSAPILRMLYARYRQLSSAITFALISLQTSALAKPRVFAVQTTFCLIAIAFTGSVAFAGTFMMPALLFNGVLT